MEIGIVILTYWVIDKVHDGIHDLRQVPLHLLVAPLTRRRDCHERGVPELPVALLHHGRSVGEDVGEHVD